MCLILFAYRCHPGFELVLLGNRDEFLARPTQPMDFWLDAPEVLGGRDLVGGGSWLAVARGGRFAAVTNYRDAPGSAADALSRGDLVSAFVRGRETAEAYACGLAERGARYGGFNLLVGDRAALYYVSNRGGGMRAVEPGLHGLSNHLLDTRWPKVERGLAGLEEALAKSAELDTVALLDVLQDRRPAPDADLPQTGVGLERERALSPIRIVTEGYGTRCSTVLAIGNDGRVRAVERNHDDSITRQFSLEGRSSR